MKDSLSSICFDDEIIFLNNFKKVIHIKIFLEKFNENLESILSDDELNNIADHFEKEQICKNNELKELQKQIENEKKIKELKKNYEYKVLNKFIKNY